MASKPRLISLLSLFVVAATLAFAQDSDNAGAKSQVFRYQQQARIDVGRRRLLPGQSGPQEKRLGRRSSNLGLQEMGTMPASGGLYRRAYNDERDGMDAAGLISGGATDIKDLKCLNILGFESKAESGTMGLRVWGDGSWLPVESLEISLSHPGSDDTQTARVHLDTGSSDFWVFDPDVFASSQPKEFALEPGSFADTVNLSQTEDINFDIRYADQSGFQGWAVEQQVQLSKNLLPIRAQRMALIYQTFNQDGPQTGVGLEGLQYAGILGLGFSSNTAFSTTRYSNNGRSIRDPTYTSVFDHMALAGALPIFTVATDKTGLSEYDFGFLVTGKARGGNSKLQRAEVIVDEHNVENTYASHDYYEGFGPSQVEWRVQIPKFAYQLHDAPDRALESQDDPSKGWQRTDDSPDSDYRIAQNSYRNFSAVIDTGSPYSYLDSQFVYNYWKEAQKMTDENFVCEGEESKNWMCYIPCDMKEKLPDIRIQWGAAEDRPITDWPILRGPGPDDVKHYSQCQKDPVDADKPNKIPAHVMPANDNFILGASFLVDNFLVFDRGQRGYFNYPCAGIWIAPLEQGEHVIKSNLQPTSLSSPTNGPSSTATSTTSSTSTSETSSTT